MSSSASASGCGIFLVNKVGDGHGSFDKEMVIWEYLGIASASGCRIFIVYGLSNERIVCKNYKQCSVS